jgi:alginate biosynthesis protein AlgX
MIFRIIILFFYVVSASCFANNHVYKVEEFAKTCNDILEQSNYDTEFLSKHWRILPGEDNWLANTSLDFPTYSNLASPAAMLELKRLERVLAGYGTKLMLVYIPARGLVYPEKLNADATSFDVASERQHFTNAMQTVRAQNVIVPDLTPLFKDDNTPSLFYEKDIHWSIEGAKMTASLVARSLDKLGLSDTSSPEKYETTYNGVSRDVANVEQAIAEICNFSFAPTYSPTYVTTEVLTPTKDSSMGLFDEVTDDIVMLGTSFSALSKFNFVGFVQQFSNAPVANYALSGGGLIGAWTNYLKSDDFHLQPPKLIVWEVPGWRELEPRYFHAFTPLFFDECEKADAIIIAENVRATVDSKISNVLFKPNSADIPAKNLMVDITFDSPHVESVKVRVWFANGGSRTYNMRHTYRTPNDGRFLTTLGNNHNYPDIKVVGMDIEELKFYESAGEKATTNFTAKLCSNPIPYSD